MAGYAAAISTASITGEPGTASEQTHLLVTHAQAGRSRSQSTGSPAVTCCALASRGASSTAFISSWPTAESRSNTPGWSPTGGFNEDATRSTGVRLDVEVVADAPQGEIKSLVNYAVGDSAWRTSSLIPPPCGWGESRLEAPGPILNTAEPGILKAVGRRSGGLILDLQH
jgi:hypothetical protein